MNLGVFKTRVKSLVLMAAIVLPLQAFASQFYLDFSTKSDGKLRFAVTSSTDVCDRADEFSMDIIDEVAGTVTPYTSSSGNQYWKVNSGKCNINQELRHEFLQYGKVLRVNTYRNGYSYPVESKRVRIPCEQQILASKSLRVGFVVEQELTAATVCGNSTSDTVVIKDEVDLGTTTTIVVPQPSNEPQQDCSISGSANQDNPQQILINADCDLRDLFDVSLYTNGQMVDNRLVDYQTRNQLVASTWRQSTATSLKLTVILNSRQGNGQFQGTVTIYKDPTFNYTVGARLLSATSDTPAKQNKALGRGNFWESVIEVDVEDRDIEANFNTQNIRVDLINIKTGQIVSSRKLSSGVSTRFNLEAQYIEPLFFGSAKWDAGSSLQNGLNRFKVRIFDAYSSTQYIETPEIQINVQK